MTWGCKTLYSFFAKANLTTWISKCEFPTDDNNVKTNFYRTHLAIERAKNVHSPELYLGEN